MVLWAINELSLKVVDVVYRSDPKYFRPSEVETLLGIPNEVKIFLVGIDHCMRNVC